MNRRSAPLFALLPLLLLSACATPQTAYSVAPPHAVESEAARQEQAIARGKWAREQDHAPESPSTAFPVSQRVGAVAERILIAAADYCQGRTMPGYAVNVGSHDKGPPVVLNASGNLHPGDRVLTLNGRDVPLGRDGYKYLNQVGGRMAGTGQPLQLTARRGNQIITASFPVIRECAFNVQIDSNDTWNAYADGDTIHVELKLAEDVSNDDDLGFVIAHELSHNILNHPAKQQQNAMVGAMAGLAMEAVIAGLGGGSASGEIAQLGAGVGGMTYSQEFEREADYVGLYILAASGYDLQAGPRIARRIAEQDPRAIRYASSHPSSADRAASLEATIAEIREKQRTGQPLVPNPAVK